MLLFTSREGYLGGSLRNPLVLINENSKGSSSVDFVEIPTVFSEIESEPSNLLKIEFKTAFCDDCNQFQDKYQYYRNSYIILRMFLKED